MSMQQRAASRRALSGEPDSPYMGSAKRSNKGLPEELRVDRPKRACTRNINYDISKLIGDESNIKNAIFSRGKSDTTNYTGANLVARGFFIINNPSPEIIPSTIDAPNGAPQGNTINVADAPSPERQVFSAMLQQLEPTVIEELQKQVESALKEHGRSSNSLRVSSKDINCNGGGQKGHSRNKGDTQQTENNQEEAGYEKANRVYDPLVVSLTRQGLSDAIASLKSVQGSQYIKSEMMYGLILPDGNGPHDFINANRIISSV
jgi:hypothetical protein